VTGFYTYPEHTPSRLLAIRTTYDTSAQQAKEEADEDDEPFNMHFAPPLL
jgi:hypothetical protein